MRSSFAHVVPQANRMRRAVVLVSTLVAVSALGAAALVSCKDDPHLRSDGGSAVSGGSCVAKPGELPEPTCDNSSNECAPQPGCTVDEQACGSASTCMPLADQKGKKQKDLRKRRLKIAAPDALAAEFIQRTVVTQNIDLDKKACGEVGKGLFTWILRVDRE